jgi:hypothetical protein
MSFRKCQINCFKFILLTFITLPFLYSQNEIVLKNSFIQKYRNLVTIDVNFYVDKSHEHPNPAKKDADLHIAGRASDVGLPMIDE